MWHRRRLGAFTEIEQACSGLWQMHTGLYHPRFELFYKADGTVDLWTEDVYDSFLDVLGS